MSLSQDQDVVEDFASERADDQFAMGVQPRRLRRALDHLEIVGLEDCVERLTALAVAVAEQEAQDSIRCPRSAAKFLACCVDHS